MEIFRYLKMHLQNMHTEHQSGSYMSPSLCSVNLWDLGIKQIFVCVGNLKMAVEALMLVYF